MTNPAETYERAIVPHLFRPWAARLVEQVALAPGERVLDVACGTGVVAREAVGRVGPGGRVVGSDFNAAMLAVAEREAGRQGLSIEWHEADARTLPFDDSAFDAVLCQQGLQFVPDRGAAIREMHRVLAPGGRLGLSVWRDLELHPFFHALDQVLRRRLGLGAAAAPFALSDAEELRGSLADAGFADVEIHQPSMTSRYPDPERNLYETIHALVAVAPELQALDEDGQQRMIEEISAEMQDAHNAVVDGDHVVLEWHANVALAKRAA